MEQQLHLDAFGAVYRFFNHPSGTFLFYVTYCSDCLIYPFGNNHFWHLKFTDKTRLVSFGGRFASTTSSPSYSPVR